MRVVGTSPRIYIVKGGHWAHSWQVLKDACAAAYRDNAFGIAKGAAYSSLLAFFPVVATLLTLLVQARAFGVSRILRDFLFEIIPPGTEDITNRLFAAYGHRPKGLLIAAAVLALWGASGAVMSLMEGFEAAYRIPHSRPWYRQRGMAILLVFIAVLPAVGASALILFGEHAQRFLLHRIGLLPDDEELQGWVYLAGTVFRYTIAFGTSIVVMALMYHFGPARKQRFHGLWPGAIFATVFWMITTVGFAWYVRNISNYNVLYGGVGAGIAILVWMYVLAVIALVGCEFNVAHERLAAIAD